jgi:glutaminase
VITRLVGEAHRRFADVLDGRVSETYPALAGADVAGFGLAVQSAGAAQPITAGSARSPFPLMSVAKPFTFALACHVLGTAEVHRRIGINATGQPFDSVAAVDASPDGRTNPMVNAGALATVAALPGDDAEQRWRWLVAGLSGFAGRPLLLDDETLDSASRTNHRNRALAWLLHSRGVLDADPTTVLDVYTRQSCLGVTAVDLAVMGATLAAGGRNPVTGDVVVGEDACRATLAAMATAGLYEDSGDWLYLVGLPGKSGIGGGIVTVSPGKGALGTWSPLLDEAGNSVRGQLAAAFLSRALGLDVFAVGASA